MYVDTDFKGMEECTVHSVSVATYSAFLPKNTVWKGDKKSEYVGET